MRFKIRTLARPADEVDLSDITAAKRTGPATWTEDGLEIPFDRALSASEVEAVELRLTTRDDTEEALRAQLEAYLALSSPSNQQNVAAIRAVAQIALRHLVAIEQPPTA